MSLTCEACDARCMLILSSGTCRAEHPSELVTVVPKTSKLICTYKTATRAGNEWTANGIKGSSTGRKSFELQTESERDNWWMTGIA